MILENLPTDNCFYFKKFFKSPFSFFSAVARVRAAPGTVVVGVPVSVGRDTFYTWSVDPRSTARRITTAQEQPRKHLPSPATAGTANEKTGAPTPRKISTPTAHTSAKAQNVIQGGSGARRSRRTPTR